MTLIPPGVFLKTFGVGGLVRRSTHEIRSRFGWYRLAPRGAALSPPAAPGPAFRVDMDSLSAATDRQLALERADRVLGGEYQAFRWNWAPLPRGRDWHRHPGGGLFPADRPWWRIGTRDPEAGDIKDVWEPGRFAWVYDLIRGYAVSRDPGYARAFLDRLSDWRSANPAFRGVHWACGQETAIRAVAVLYAEANLPGVACHQDVSWLLAASGERIRDAIGFARSQRNNHAVSEAVGLLAIGDRLAAAHPDGERWRRQGHRLLARLIPAQFAKDGWYVQHSFAYLRLAVDQCLVAARVLRARGHGMDRSIRLRLTAALALVDAVIDPATGIVPNHGPNDGAFVHPVTLADYRDYRPLLTALAGELGEPLTADIAPDREALAWLGLAAPPPGAVRRDGIRVGSSGWAVLRRGSGFVFLRAGSYRTRPGHFDPLHVDVRLGSDEVIVDAGTFRYGGPAPWRDVLAGPDLHNGPAGDADRTAKGPRFLWRRWPQSEIVETVDSPTASVVVAEVPGRFRREVSATATGTVVIADSAIGPNQEAFRQTWLLHPAALDGWVDFGAAIPTAATEADPRGWFSPRYGERVASRYVTVERHRAAPPTRVRIRRGGAE